mmetsp:Transcript_14763/g.27687  ORF Transcript_14763/g.27687 Transcript_14763/m.27687 type:complete len:888 (+) Transcript_14763:149-2812(+)
MWQWLLLFTVFTPSGAYVSYKFNPKCNHSEYNIVPSNTSLPILSSTDAVLASIMPSYSRDRSISEFMDMYHQGLQRCEAHSHSLDSSSGRDQFQVQHIFNEAGVFAGCRGRKLLRELTGMTVWPFGPVASCSTHSACWFGLLSCGNFSAAHLSRVLAAIPSGRSSRRSAELQWSLRALHVDMSVRGPELLVPRVRLIPLPDDPSIDVIIADYTLTVDGAYRLQLDLQGFYPSTLSSRQAHSSASQGRDMGEARQLNTITKHKPLRKKSHLAADRLPSYRHPEHKLLRKPSPLAVYDRFEKVGVGEEEETGGSHDSTQLGHSRAESASKKRPVHKTKPIPSILQRLRDNKQWEPRFSDQSSSDPADSSSQQKYFRVDANSSQQMEPLSPEESGFFSTSSARHLAGRNVKRPSGKSASTKELQYRERTRPKPKPLLSPLPPLHSGGDKSDKKKPRKPHVPSGGASHSRSETETELVPSVFLGDCEKRVESGRQYYCLAECDELSQVHGSPFEVQASFGGERCSDSSAGGGDALPFCSSGGHAGRYLRIPPPLVKLCGAEKFTAMYKKEKKAQQGKRQYFDRYAAIQAKYIEHANGVKLQRKTVDPILMSSNGDFSASHRRELSTYIAKENFCLLVDIAQLDAKGDEIRAEVFAPHQCRYRLFSKQQVSQCFREKGLKHLLFHGDSMMRAIFGAFTRNFGDSLMSEEKLKEMTNVKKTDEIYAVVGGATVLEKYTWNVRDDFLAKTWDSSNPSLLPDVFFINFAFAHSLTVDVQGLILHLRHSHETVKFIEQHYTGNSSLSRQPKLAIFQSASAMHGKRNFGFHWMSEVVRRQNAQMRSLLVDQLGFLDFDEFLLTAAYFGKTNFRDGWHYNGVPMLNSVQVLMNMMCAP